MADGAQDLANISGLSDIAKSVTAFSVRKWTSRLRMLRALLSGEPLSVAVYREPKLHTAIQQKCRELKPDLVISYSGNMAPYAEHFPEKPRIAQFSDLDSLKWEQYARHSSVPMKWIYQIEHRRVLVYERHIGRSFGHSLVCTRQEKRDFKRLIPDVPVTVVGNGVDLDYFRRTGQPKTPASMIFTGVMDYLPNVDAVVWFCAEILPLIQAKIPQANFTICGSRPNGAVRRLAERTGVTVTGRVPDTRPYLDAAEVFVAPLRMARGIQNKVLEALAMGLPCVASMAAWNGTVIPQGEGILATDDPSQFAEHVIRLLQDDVYRAEMAGKARLAAETNYSWDTQMKALDRVVAEVTARGKNEPSKEVAIT
jgi:sugar transferase (PEP-CTERM/EpsH1 system associated)